MNVIINWTTDVILLCLLITLLIALIGLVFCLIGMIVSMITDTFGDQLESFYKWRQKRHRRKNN